MLYEKNIEDIEDNNNIINNDVYLNDDWIKEFKTIDKNYQEFYLDDLTNIKLTIIYIDRNNEIIKTKQEKIYLNETNYISREELIKILKINAFLENIKYTLLSILKCNIDIQPTEVKHFLNIEINDYYERFVTPIKNIDTILFNKSIYMFSDLNELIVVFHEKCEKENKPHNITKRIYIQSKQNNHKRTIRNNNS